MSATGHGYRTLKSIFHERGEAAVQEELQVRRNGYSTYLLNDFMVGEHPCSTWWIVPCLPITTVLWCGSGLSNS